MRRGTVTGGPSSSKRLALAVDFTLRNAVLIVVYLSLSGCYQVYRESLVAGLPDVLKSADTTVPNQGRGTSGTDSDEEEKGEDGPKTDEDRAEEEAEARAAERLRKEKEEPASQSQKQANKEAGKKTETEKEREQEKEDEEKEDEEDANDDEEEKAGEEGTEVAEDQAGKKDGKQDTTETDAAEDHRGAGMAATEGSNRAQEAAAAAAAARQTEERSAEARPERLAHKASSQDAVASSPASAQAAVLGEVVEERPPPRAQRQAGVELSEDQEQPLKRLGVKTTTVPPPKLKRRPRLGDVEAEESQAKEPGATLPRPRAQFTQPETGREATGSAARRGRGKTRQAEEDDKTDAGDAAGAGHRRWRAAPATEADGEEGGGAPRYMVGRGPVRRRGSSAVAAAAETVVVGEVEQESPQRPSAADARVGRGGPGAISATPASEGAGTALLEDGPLIIAPTTRASMGSLAGTASPKAAAATQEATSPATQAPAALRGAGAAAAGPLGEVFLESHQSASPTGPVSGDSGQGLARARSRAAATPTSRTKRSEAAEVEATSKTAAFADRSGGKNGATPSAAQVASDGAKARGDSEDSDGTHDLLVTADSGPSSVASAGAQVTGSVGLPRAETLPAAPQAQSALHRRPAAADSSGFSAAAGARAVAEPAEIVGQVQAEAATPRQQRRPQNSAVGAESTAAPAVAGAVAAEGKKAAGGTVAPAVRASPVAQREAEQETEPSVPRAQSKPAAQPANAARSEPVAQVETEGQQAATIAQPELAVDGQRRQPEPAAQQKLPGPTSQQDQPEPVPQKELPAQPEPAAQQEKPGPAVQKEKLAQPERSAQEEQPTLAVRKERPEQPGLGEHEEQPKPVVQKEKQPEPSVQPEKQEKLEQPIRPKAAAQQEQREPTAEPVGAAQLAPRVQLETAERQEPAAPQEPPGPAAQQLESATRPAATPLQAAAAEDLRN